MSFEIIFVCFHVTVKSYSRQHCSDLSAPICASSWGAIQKSDFHLPNGLTFLPASLHPWRAPSLPHSPPASLPPFLPFSLLPSFPPSLPPSLTHSLTHSHPSPFFLLYICVLYMFTYIHMYTYAYVYIYMYKYLYTTRAGRGVLGRAGLAWAGLVLARPGWGGLCAYFRA